MNEQKLRKNLLELLEGGGAHLGMKKALAGLKPTLRTAKPAEAVHSVYEELEHLRLAQEDILRYTLDPSWESPPWPEGYWPGDTKKLTDKKWKETVSGFFEDLEAVIAYLLTLE